MSGSNMIRFGFRTARFLRMIQTEFTAVRSCGWVRDYKPAPLPKTPEEREAAARKYNLIPEDYETHEDGSGFGDYPKLPVVSQDVMNPYDDYDYYYRRRNYAETLHVDYDILCSEKLNPNVRYRFTLWQMMSGLVGSFLFLSLVKFIDSYYGLHTANPMKPKAYAWDGKKHYTFEPLD